MDWSRWGSTTRGITNYECLVAETDRPGTVPWYERQPGLTVLYRSQTLMADSNLAHRPIAWKSEATPQEIAAGSDRGRVVCFAFNPFYFEVPSMQTALAQVIHWLVTGEEL